MILHRSIDGVNRELFFLQSGTFIPILIPPIWAQNRKLFATAFGTETDISKGEMKIGLCDKDGCRLLFEDQNYISGLEWDDTKNFVPRKLICLVSEEKVTCPKKPVE